ncbi:sugar transferase [Chitinophaga barathri]|uniref:Sugar transferase n=1 Tax=Chitinophaga barathri TaxID=1647451 RepID=A0A3N4MFM3_9BACT|nr:sugar transferase [Chitinophaga barathri]RPD40477.1 sugar transferase [Chitinophaga barathri]
MYKFLKRLLDIVISLMVLLILSPFLLIICILLKLTGEGEIFYFQKRIGYKNQYFYIWKFATMLKNSPNMGTGEITLRNDPRVTPLGGFLRITKINELPQIINVLKGDMSLVGPRPLVDKTFNAYPENVQKRVYDSKPGITGIGSIVFRDEELLISSATVPPAQYYEAVIAPYKGELELWYQQHKSLITDLKLIFLTAWVIIFPNSKLPYKLRNLPQRKI